MTIKHYSRPHLEAQRPPQQRVRPLDAVGLGVLAAVSVGETLQVEAGEEVHGFGGLHQGATCWDVHQLARTHRHTNLMSVHSAQDWQEAGPTAPSPGCP